jgi:Dolichyl-phosphate-mannose-protein mannosyltransferase
VKTNNLIREWLWLFALASISSLIIISWSFERGRLQYEMDYEDIITHIDGLQRWRDLSEGGIGQLLANYSKTPPHCPLHSFMAASGFMLFGVHDWAPYVLNVFVLFAFLALVRRETRGFGFYPSALAVLGALAVPVSFQSIHQFRPDFPCALATLWGMIVYPRWGEKRFLTKAAISGACFGLALLSKPPFFPYTLAMGALPWLFTVVEEIKERRSVAGAWLPIMKSWPFFISTALVAGPHYIVAWKRILEYIDLNQFGENAHVWRMTGGLAFQLAYHIFGYSGNFMLGQAVWVVLALAGCGLLLAAVRFKCDQDRANHFLRLLGFSAWAWVFIAWNPHMNPFFGLTFQYMVVITGMFSAAWMFRLALDATFPVKVVAVLPLAVIASMVVMAFPFTDYDQKFTSANPEIHAFAKKMPADVYHVLTKWRRFSDSGYTLLSTYGIVSSHRLQWLAAKDREDFTFYGVPYWPIEKLIPLFDQNSKSNHRVDFAIVTEPGAEGVFEELPNSKTSGGLLDHLQKQETYTHVDTLLTPLKKKYFLYMATPNFSVFDVTDGLAPKSAPLYIEGTPVVRPATSGRVSLDYVSPTSGSAKIELAMRGQFPLAEITVAINGNRVERFLMTPTVEFLEKAFTADLKQGLNRIEVHLLDSIGKEVANPSVQFRRIRITPPGDSSPMEDIIRKSGTGGDQ